MLLLQTPFSLNFVSAVNRYIFFHLPFMIVFLFLKLWTVPCILLLVPCIIFFPSFPLSTFCLPASLLSLNKFSPWSMWLDQPSTACHLKFILLQISLKNPPSFLFPFIILDLFFSKTEYFSSNDAKHKHLYVWEDFLIIPLLQKDSFLNVNIPNDLC